MTEFEKDKSFDYASELIYKIAKIKDETKEVNSTDITPFEWDKAYVFDINTPIEKIYKKVGYKWTSISEKEKESEFQIVFLNNEKVVCYLFGSSDMMGISMNFNKSSYKDGIIEIAPNKNSKFSVKKGKEVFETHLTHMDNL